MKLRYTVSQDRYSRLWYAHMVGFPYIPVMESGRGCMFATKREALQVAADCEGLSLKEYMKLRAQNRR